MLNFIKGKVLSVKPDRVFVQVGQVGLLIKIPLRISKDLKENEEFLFYTSLTLREDKVELYGFLNIYERDLFEELLNLSGIGPKTAMNILSTYDNSTLQRIIEMDDIKSLGKIPGIGKKNAQRILLELKGVLPYFKYERDQIFEDILSALTNLGYKRKEAKEVLEKIYRKDKDEESIIKECLVALSGKDAK
ncbi:MAG: Holliday junction branch migration protein RuvA [Thermodesulfovibrionaceae bacterium]